MRYWKYVPQFWDGIKNLKTVRKVGAFFPSTKYVGMKITELIDGSRNIVELGSGMGDISEVILKSLPYDGRLVCIENNQEYITGLRERMRDKRVVISTRNAQDLEFIVRESGLKEVDAIVSGIPLFWLKGWQVYELLDRCNEVLSFDGIFVQYQYTFKNIKKMEETFSHGMPIQLEWRNLPPTLIVPFKKVKEFVTV